MINLCIALEISSSPVTTIWKAVQNVENGWFGVVLCKKNSCKNDSTECRRVSNIINFKVKSDEQCQVITSWHTCSSLKKAIGGMPLDREIFAGTAFRCVAAIYTVDQRRDYSRWWPFQRCWRRKVDSLCLPPSLHYHWRLSSNLST